LLFSFPLLNPTIAALKHVKCINRSKFKSYIYEELTVGWTEDEEPLLRFRLEVRILPGDSKSNKMGSIVCFKLISSFFGDIGVEVNRWIWWLGSQQARPPLLTNHQHRPNHPVFFVTVLWDVGIGNEVNVHHSKDYWSDLPCSCAVCSPIPPLAMPCLRPPAPPESS
jgi:hypothetical protein